MTAIVWARQRWQRGYEIGRDVRRDQTTVWNIKKHEISWSKRNSPNYYNLANIRPTSQPVSQRAHMRFSNSRCLICRYTINFVCFPHLFIVLFAQIIFDRYICQMVTFTRIGTSTSTMTATVAYLNWYLFNVCLFVFFIFIFSFFSFFSFFFVVFSVRLLVWIG